MTQSALVIGGGVSGMNAALDLADQGFKTYLIEEKDTAWRPCPEAQKNLEGRRSTAIYRQASQPGAGQREDRGPHRGKMSAVKGFVGQFSTTVQVKGAAREIEHGVAILATGAHSLKPSEYLYGQSERVTRWHELDRLFEDDPKRLDEAKAMAFIQCVGSREPERPYCSKICCTASVQKAVEFKKRSPDLDVYILYRDIRTYGLREEFYTQRKRARSDFSSVPVDEKPVVER